MKTIVRMSAGLANRMFQYSYYLFLKKNGIDAYVDNNYKATKYKMEDIDWGRIFPQAKIKQAPDSLIFRLGGGYNLLSKIRRHYLTLFSNVQIMPSAFNYLKPDEIQGNKYLIGVFQTAEMVKNVEKEVQSMFKFSDFTDDRNLSLAKQMSSENSVAIHIRKGEDYLLRPDYKGTCPVEYYQKAVECIKSKIDNPYFYVFTDNPEWVKQNITGIEYKLVEGNPPVGWGNHFDMQLMSFCKHNIISNSTYSWWSAFLNTNPNKIVIGPAIWFNPEMKKYEEVNNVTISDDWIRM
jgi:Glycosyl transferase family 11.